MAFQESESDRGAFAGCRGQIVKVLRVIDGDTLEIQRGDKKEKVRLLGVDTPETKHPEKPVEPYGPEATEFVRSLTEGKSICLDYDRDKYHRLLAYVYTSDNIFLNAELIRKGYARTYTKYPFYPEYMNLFFDLEEQAWKKGAGLWESKEKSPLLWVESIPEGLSPDSIVFVTRTGKRYHRETCRFTQCSGKSASIKHAARFGLGACRACRPPVFSLAGEDVAAENMARKQCLAITRRGARCKHMISSDGNFCWQHQRLI
jgi:micrococcal nuclease